MNPVKGRPIPELKQKIVAELGDLIKNKKTILFASIKNLPASQFQEISKKLRKKAIVKVPKKNLFFRAIDSAGEEAVKKLEAKFDNGVAILFSDIDGFELAAELLNNKIPAKAKPGQEAPEDIEIEAGMTELVPGPAISELGAVGLKTKVTNGKLEIINAKIIAKQGEKISQSAADIMAKLDIKPFSIGFVPLCVFDNVEKKFYAEIEIDKEDALEKLKSAYGKALAFSVEVGHANEDTIKFLIGKAGRHEKAIRNLVGKENSEDKVEKKIREEENSEEKEDNQTQSDKTEGEEK